ncbi:hypothetical protein BDZ91DRAFT_554461 [Kalaharituber pfeilii]|nr:hypothetical protein BDZ91DRAFT_554461 [Kalaharituber pfeilii]
MYISATGLLFTLIGTTLWLVLIGAIDFIIFLQTVLSPLSSSVHLIFPLLQYDDPSQSIQRVLHPQLCALSLFKPPSISIFSRVEITLAVCNLLRSPRKWVPGPRSSVAGNMLGNVPLARSMGRLAMSSGVRSVWYQSPDMISVFGILEG